MDPNTLMQVMTGAVVVSAVAIVIQMGLLIGMYMAVRTVQKQVANFLPKAESLIETAQRTVEQSKQQVLDITAKANEVMDSTKRQLAKVEDVLQDATARAKSQMDRVEMVLDDTISRVHETVTTLHNGVMRPLREVNGVAVGFRAALQHLLRGGRPTVAQATSDEEMFI